MTLHIEKINTNKNINTIKIALISDIHFYPNFNKKIFNKLEKQLATNKPNYICIAGDILDDSKYTNLDKLTIFLKNISKVAPIITILGNHDEKSGHMRNWSHKKNDYLIKTLTNIPNLYFLDDTIYQDNNIIFYGFNLSYKHYEIDNESYKSFKQEINSLKFPIPDSNQNNYIITLFHSPINIYKFIEENKAHNLNKTDLILSGHMHNGCLPYWFTKFLNKCFKTTRGIISPQRKLFTKYSHSRVFTPKDGFIYEGVTKLSKSTKLFHYFDFLFSKNVQFIEIHKKNDV